MKWFEQFRVSVLSWGFPSSFCSRGNIIWKEILFEVLKTAPMVAQHNDSAGCESSIPSLMPYKLSNCALFFLILNSSELLPYHTQSFKHIHGQTFLYLLVLYYTAVHLNIILWRYNISVSVIWTNPIYIKVNFHVLRQQLICFRLTICNYCLWIWRLSTWLVTSSYAVLTIQAALQLRHYTAHLFLWPSELGQKSSVNGQELLLSLTTGSTARNKINRCCLKNFNMNYLSIFDVWKELL